MDENHDANVLAASASIFDTLICKSLEWAGPSYGATMKACNLQQIVILLVEDDTAVGRVTAARLKKRGFEVLTALTGEESVAMVKSAQRIDLILMDISLGPGMDGIRAAQQIYQVRNLPILFLSSHTDTETVSEAEKVSPYGFVAKGTELSVLSAAIHVALRLHEAYTRLNRLTNIENLYEIGCGSFQDAI